MSPPAVPLFSFRSVSVEYDGVTALDGVTLDLRSTGIVMVTGPSGSGKSTLLRLCNRLEAPTTGALYFRGEDVAALAPRALRRRVGMVFQRPTPFSGSVADNFRVAVPTMTSADCVDLLGSVRLGPEFLDRDAASLSGGECQRVCLARTLATRPEVVLMDEPTSALDDENRLALEDLALGLVEQGVSIVWVSHDRSQIDRLADQVVELEAGRVGA